MEKKTYIISENAPTFLTLEELKGELGMIQEANEVWVNSNLKKPQLALLFGAALAMDKPIFRLKDLVERDYLDTIVSGVSEEWEEADK